MLGVFKWFATVLMVLLAGCGTSLPDLAKATEPQVKDMRALEKIEEIKLRKARFVELLLPVVMAENARLLTVRQQIQALREDALDNDLSDEEAQWLETLAEKYRVQQAITSPAFFDALLLRVDIVPVSLVLAQAALESSWGRSRFARQGNNLFGHWCFEAGCGIVPKQRASGASHEVARFSSVNDSVRAYLLNLNRKPQYETLRRVRGEWRKQGDSQNRPLSGVLLATGLTKYSELGEAYVGRVRAVIRQNNLDQLDHAS